MSSQEQINASIQEVVDTKWKLLRIPFFESAIFAKGRLENKDVIFDRSWRDKKAKHPLNYRRIASHSNSFGKSKPYVCSFATWRGVLRCCGDSRRLFQSLAKT